MAAQISRKIANDMSDVIAFLKEARVFLEEHQITGDALYAVRLTLDELLTNVLKYALPKDTVSSFEAGVTIHQDTVEIFVRDSGAPFDPKEAKKPDLHRKPEDIQPGGLGLHLVRSMAVRIDYKREQDHNFTRVLIERIRNSGSAS